MPRLAPRLIAAALLLLLALPQPARGHAVLLETTPADGATLAAAPEAIVLRFNELVRPIHVQLLHAEAEAPLEPPLEVVGHEVRVPLAEPLADGTWLVSHRVTSADGHPVGGAFTFTVGAASALPPELAPDEWEGWWRGADLALRALWYGLLLAIAGHGLFLALIRPPPPLDIALRRTISLLAPVALMVGVLVLGVVGGALLGAAPDSLATSRPWRLAAQSPIAWSVTAASLGLVLLALAARRGMTALLAAGAVLVALSFALSGHAVTASPRWLTTPAVALHALFAAFWLGSLWPLLRAVRHLPAAEAAGVVAAFSRLALASVAGLLLAGTVLAIVQLESFAALPGTDYGQRLALKLALVAGLLALAVLNRLALTPALAAGRPGGARGLRRTLGADLALGAGVVILTASLNATPPPRALVHDHPDHHHHHEEAAPAREYAVHATAQGRHLVLVASPARAGTNRIELFFADASWQPLPGEAAELRLGPPGREDAPLRLEAEPIEAGRFVVEAAVLPLPGTWQVRVDLLIDDFTKPIFRTKIPIEP